MRSISIRQFQRNFYTELKDVPFIVVRKFWEGEKGSRVFREVPEFIVSHYDEQLLPHVPEHPVQHAEPSEPQPEPQSPVMVTEPEPEKKGIRDMLSELFRHDK